MDKKNNYGNGKIWTLLVVLLVGIGLLMYFNSYETEPLPSTSNVIEDQPEATDIEYADEEIDVSPDEGITADDVLENPELYEGSVVNLKAEVEEWINPRAFVLDAPGFINDNLLVITREPTYVFEDPELFGDDIWGVTGTVDRFTFVEVIDSLDADLEADLFTVYEGAPYIIADTVELYED